jgi:hypothetical protein
VHSQICHVRSRWLSVVQTASVSLEPCTRQVEDTANSKSSSRRGAAMRCWLLCCSSKLAAQSAPAEAASVAPGGHSNFSMHSSKLSRVAASLACQQLQQ